MASPRQRRAPVWRPILLGFCVLLLLVGVILGTRWLTTGSYFRVTRVEINGFKYLQRETIAERAHHVLGQNIWVMDAEALADSLKTLAWVRRADVSRRPPATLRIHAEEWRPLLLVVREDAPDASGRAVLLASGEMQTFPQHLPLPDLPYLILDAPTYADFAKPRAESPNESVTEVLDLMNALENSGLPALNFVDYLNIEQRGYMLTIGPDQHKLLLGRTDFPGRLKRYLAVQGDVAQGAFVDLRFSGQVYIRDKP